MNRKEANKIIEKHSAAFGALPREAIEAIEYLINAEPCREADDYENEIADLQNRLDIAEYDKDRWKEKVTVLEEKLKSLSAEPCEDTISRQAVFEQINCWIGSGEYRYTNATDYLTKRISKLPPVTPKQKMGHWINYQKNIWIYAQCSECGTVHDTQTNYCPNCGAKMEESENG